MKCGTIYCIRNMKNSKVYIGQTHKYSQRVREHKYKLNNNKHPNKYLQNSWNKYGERSFEFFIMLDNLDLEDLNRKEVLLIGLYDSNNKNKGYNLTLGGMGVRGYKMSPEDIEKIQKNRSPYTRGEEHHFYNKSHSKEVRKIISVCMTGEGNGMYGSKHSEETKNKISRAMKKANTKNPRYKKYSKYTSEILTLSSQGFTQSKISKKLNIPQPTVSLILNNKY